MIDPQVRAEHGVQSPQRDRGQICDPGPFSGPGITPRGQIGGCYGASAVAASSAIAKEKRVLRTLLRLLLRLRCLVDVMGRRYLRAGVEVYKFALAREIRFEPAHPLQPQIRQIIMWYLDAIAVAMRNSRDTTALGSLPTCHPIRLPGLAPG